MVLEPDGDYSVYVGSSAIGQGLETSFAQIAADALEVPMDRINGVRHGSTSYVSDGYGAYHSRSVVMGGSAMLDAASNLRQAIRAEAAERLHCAPSEIEIVDGSKAVGPAGKSVALKGLSSEGISAEGAFLNKKHTYTYGAHAAHVAVDPKLGHVELIDYVIVEDCGRAINPLTVHGQAIGSAVQGLGGAFMEHLVYDQQAQLLTGSLADYLIPTASDFPNIRAVVLEDHPSPINPLGAKGAGEGGIIAAGGVMANAVANALGSFGVRPDRAAADADADLGDGAGRSRADQVSLPPVRWRCVVDGAIGRSLDSSQPISPIGASHERCTASAAAGTRRRPDRGHHAEICRPLPRKEARLGGVRGRQDRGLQARRSTASSAPAAPASTATRP